MLRVIITWDQANRRAFECFWSNASSFSAIWSEGLQQYTNSYVHSRWLRWLEANGREDLEESITE